ncbi:MAG: T9SS type A sorting domain-containing protein [Ferruginibacter sp.]
MKKILVTIFSCLLLGRSFAQTNNDSIRAKLLSKQKTVDSLQAADKAQLAIYPNPAKNKVTLQVKGFEPGTASVKILDYKGKLLRDDSRLLTNGAEDIIMFLMLQPGIYFIIVSEKGKVARKKLIML